MSILPHTRMPERDHVPAASVAFVVPDQTMPLSAASVDDVLRIVDTHDVADVPTFAELVPGPVVVCVDELAALEDCHAGAIVQRAELHLDLSDNLLRDLAARAVYPRRPLWRRLAARIGGVR